MKNTFISLLFLITFVQCVSQKQTVIGEKPSYNKKPKLVVGIVVDQMRYDYLIRFYDKYSNNGFKRLINNGFNCENTHLNYVPTHTAVGHSSIYTGTTPNIHGIVANNWFDKTINESVYCVDDGNYNTVGADTGGKKSPRRLKVTTISDQLHLAQQGKGKMIGISLKDRGSILPVGHTANAAYWFKGGSLGHFITSSYYMENLPKWVSDFNENKKANNYLKKPWKTLYNINTYTESIEDDNAFEEPLKGGNSVTFPHDLPTIFKKENNYGLIRSTPFGNSLLVDFAEAVIIGENLGNNLKTDFLSISFSSTDYVGHTFGVDSKEVEDTYLRLDKDLERLLNFLDQKVGANNYTLFLTADHGALSPSAYLSSLKIPSKLFDYDGFDKLTKKITQEHFNSSDLIENFSNTQLFFNQKTLKNLNLNGNQVAEILANELINFEGIANCITAKTMQTTNFTKGILSYTQNGYNQKKSGDLILIPEPGTVFYHYIGSEHRSGYSYDTHVPLLFYGFGIKKGNTKRYIPIVDVASTISSILKIEFPSGNSGKIIEEALKQ
jgi:hypothetical protein